MEGVRAFQEVKQRWTKESHDSLILSIDANTITILI
jgi:hypothetical protein